MTPNRIKEAVNELVRAIREQLENGKTFSEVPLELGDFTRTTWHEYDITLTDRRFNRHKGKYIDISPGHPVYAVAEFGEAELTYKGPGAMRINKLTVIYKRLARHNDT